MTVHVCSHAISKLNFNVAKCVLAEVCPTSIQTPAPSPLQVPHVVAFSAVGRASGLSDCGVSATILTRLPIPFPPVLMQEVTLTWLTLALT